MLKGVTGSSSASAASLQTQLAASLPNTRKALANIRLGSGRLRMLVIGDSTTVGAGSGSGAPPALTGAWPTGPCPQMASQLRANNLVAYDNSFIGNQNVSGTISYPLYDTRSTIGASWTPSSERTLGGAMWRFTNAATTNLVMSLNLSGSFVDTVTVYYFRFGTNGTFTVTAGDNIIGTTVNTSGATGIQSVTINCLRANNVTATITATSGTNTMLIMAIVGLDSTIPAIDLLQSGFYGGTASDAVGVASYGSLAMLAALTPTVTFIELTINDARIGTSIATYTAQMQTLITAAKAVGDVVIVAGIPSDSTIAPLATTAQFDQACQSLAAANNCPFISIAGRWVSYTVSNALGYYYDTTGHATALGYSDKAAAYVELIRAVA